MTAQWWTLRETMEHLGVRSVDTMRARMRETPGHIDRPWVNAGSAGKRALYSFESSKVDRWWREVNEWRASVRGEENGRSDGATLTGRSGADCAQRGRPPRSSSAKSKTLTPLGDGGSFLALLRPQTSRPA